MCEVAVSRSVTDGGELMDYGLLDAVQLQFVSSYCVPTVATLKKQAPQPSNEAHPLLAPDSASISSRDAQLTFDCVRFPVPQTLRPRVRLQRRHLPERVLPAPGVLQTPEAHLAGVGRALHHR